MRWVPSVVARLEARNHDRQSTHGCWDRSWHLGSEDSVEFRWNRRDCIRSPVSRGNAQIDEYHSENLIHWLAPNPPDARVTDHEGRIWKRPVERLVLFIRKGLVGATCLPFE